MEYGADTHGTLVDGAEGSWQAELIVIAEDPKNDLILVDTNVLCY